MTGSTTILNRHSLHAAALCLAMLAVLMAACGESPEAEAQKFMESAQRSYDAGDFNGAFIELKNALQKRPDNAAARLLLGRIYLDAGDGVSAEKELAHAWELGNRTDDVRLLLTQARLRQGNYEAVLEDVPADLGFESSIMLDFLTARAEALLGLGRAHEAIEVFKDIVARRPQAMSYAGLARATFLVGQHDQAMEYLDKGLALNPESAELYALSGQFNFQLNKRNEAEAGYTSALGLDGENVRALMGLANLRIITKNYDKAWEYLNRAAASAPLDMPTAMLGGYVSLARKDFAGAKQLSDAVLVIDQTILTALYVAGVSAYALNGFERAKDLLTQYSVSVPHDKQAQAILDDVTVILASGRQDANPALLEEVSTMALDAGRRQLGLQSRMALAESAPDDPKLQAGVSIAKVMTGDMSAAEDDLLRALESDPASQNRAVDRATLVLIIGQLKQGDFDKALEATDRLQERMPNMEISYVLAGVAHTGKRGFDEARKAFKRARDLNPDSPNAVTSLSALLMQEGKAEVATNVLLQMVAVQPDHYPTNLRLGMVYIQQNRRENAIEWLEKAATLRAGAVAPRILLGRLFLDSGDFQRVLQETEAVMEEHPREKGLLTLSGSARLALGQVEEAASDFRSLVEVAPDVAESHFLLAAAYARLGEEEKVRSELEATLAIDPAHVKARLTLARFFLGKNDLAAAKPLVESLTKDNPNDFEVLNIRADVALREGNNEEAFASLSKAHRLEETSATALTLAQAQWRAGARDDSLKTLEYWLEESPKDVGNRTYLAQFYLALGREDESLEHFLIVVEDQPDSWLALNQAAWLLDRKGNGNEALKYAERSYELAPENPEVADTLAVILLGQGDIERALPLLANANELAPENPGIAFHYADALAKSGDKAKSKEILSSILAGEEAFSERDAAQSLLEALGSN